MDRKLEHYLPCVISTVEEKHSKENILKTETIKASDVNEKHGDPESRERIRVSHYLCISMKM